MSALIKTEYQQCLDVCVECLIDCKVCLAKMVGQKSMNDCPYCCVQSIATLEATIALLTAESDLAKEQCALCARACAFCAEQCAEHTDHAHCQQCAESSRRCAEACRKMTA